MEQQQRPDHGNVKHVLITEDNPVSMRILQTLLTRTLPKTGWRIHTATNATHAMYLIEQTKFEFIFLDLMLPDGNGEDVARQCRTTTLNANATLIAMTAYEQTANPYPFSYRFEKPITVAQLKQVLRPVL